MPMDMSKYPANWFEIADNVKSSVGWKCQICGKQCFRPGEPVTDTRRVLTTAHVNHEPMDCRPENLVAACSVCHLRYDNLHRQFRRAARARVRKDNEVSRMYGGKE